MSSPLKRSALALAAGAVLVLAAAGAQAADGDITIDNGPNTTCVKIEGHPVQSAGWSCVLTACRWVCRALGSVGVGNPPTDSDPGHYLPGTIHIPADLWQGGSDSDNDDGGQGGSGNGGANGSGGGNAGAGNSGGASGGGSDSGGSGNGGTNGGSGAGAGSTASGDDGGSTNRGRLRFR